MNVSKMAWFGSPTRTQFPPGPESKPRISCCKLTRILGFILQNERKAITHTLEIFLIHFEDVSARRMRSSKSTAAR